MTETVDRLEFDEEVEAAPKPEPTSSLPLDADPEVPDGPKWIKRKLRARDIKRVARILGKIQKLAREEFGQQQVSQAQIISLILTDGLEVAEEEINLWVADLCKFKAKNVAPDASEQQQHDALVEQIAEMDITIYTEVFEDLERFGKLNPFLTQATRVWRRLFPAEEKTPTPSESTPSAPDTDGASNT